MSTLLTAIMILTTALPTFAATSMQDAGGTANFSGVVGNNVWSRSSQFLRITVLWAPYAGPNDGHVDADGITWDENKVIRIGDTFDWALGDGNNPYNTVYKHSRFKSAYDYHKDGSADMTEWSSYTKPYGQTWFFQPGSIKGDNGQTLEFPRRVGGANNVDTKYFFQQYEVLNEVLYMAGETASGRAEKKEGYGAGAINVTKLKAGIYTYEDGYQEAGKYLIMVEPGAYMPINGLFTAFTMRDALAWGRGGPTSVAPAVVADLANALQIEEDSNIYHDLGLKYHDKEYGNITSAMSGQYGSIREHAGLGLIWYNESMQLPIINYYYLLKPGEYEIGTVGGEGAEASIGGVVVKEEALTRRANTADEVENAGKTYEADRFRTKVINGKEVEFMLIQGYLESVDTIGGYLDITDSGLQFVNKSGLPEITDLVKEYIGYDITQEDIKEWKTAIDTKATVEEITRVTGLQTKEEQIADTGRGTIEANFGESLGKVQSNFLYIAFDDPLVDLTSGIVPTMPNTPDPEDEDIETIEPGTFVTKMYYETPEDPKPSKITTEPLGRDDSYKVPDKEDMYKMEDWVVVPDETPGMPEPYDDYDEAEADGTKSGSNPETLGPENWKDPDSELVIKFVKEPSERIDADLILPEKRISWLKDLDDIGGRPTITFEWDARDGEETHYCDSKNCDGHTCRERVGSDNILNFLASNLNAVASKIMGNAAGFYPYDEDNEKLYHPPLSDGEYEMHPNYGFVIWRGQDIPTIASYKYGSGTGNEVASSIPGVISLLGDGMKGIQPQGARHPENNGYYTDIFTLVIGKSDYDCSRYAAFQAAFGDRAQGSEAIDKLVTQKHNQLAQYETSVERYKDAVAEYEYAKARYENEHDWYDRWRLKDAVERAEAAMKTAETNKLNAATKYNTTAAQLGLTNDQLGEGTKANGLNINIGDYDYSSRWSYCGKVNWYTASGDQTDYDVTVRVDVGYGSENTGDAKVTFKSENLSAAGEDFTHVQGFAVNNTKPIRFYPYVEMFYDTTTGQEEQTVMVLGGHRSTFVPQDYIEIGYLVKSANVETTTGLVLQSQQWSTHQAALSLSGGKKNVVLPGGAIYRLQTPGNGTNGNTRSKVAMSSWLTFLPEDTINATIEGKELYNGAVQNAKNEMLYREVLNNLNSLDIVQIVDGTMVDQVQAGNQRVPGTSGQPTSTDAKYWLRQNLKDGSGAPGAPATIDQAIKVNSPKTNEADLDIISQKEERIYYRVYSDVQGNVYVSKSTASADATKPGSGTILGKISKTQSLDELLAQNTEIKALNNRTKLVENFINAIDRNTGNDVSISDSKWYNEAWDGICVVRINKVVEMGFKDSNANSATRTSALDPKLQTKRTSQGDMYKTGIKSWFETDKHTNYSDKAGYVGTFDSTSTGAGKTEIILKDMNGLYRSKEFIIPNISVMELY